MGPLAPEEQHELPALVHLRVLDQVLGELFPPLALHQMSHAICLELAFQVSLLAEGTGNHLERIQVISLHPEVYLIGV